MQEHYQFAIAAEGIVAIAASNGLLQKIHRREDSGQWGLSLSGMLHDIMQLLAEMKKKKKENECSVAQCTRNNNTPRNGFHQNKQKAPSIHTLIPDLHSPLYTLREKRKRWNLCPDEPLLVPFFRLSFPPFFGPVPNVRQGSRGKNRWAVCR